MQEAPVELTTEVELDSPNFVPATLDKFRASGFSRRNRRTSVSHEQLVELTTVDGVTVLAPADAMLFALADWLLRRQRSALPPGGSVATSRVRDSLTATIEVHRTSEGEGMVPALSERTLPE